MEEVRIPTWTTVFQNKGPKIQNTACGIGVSRNMSSWNILVKALLDMLKLFSQKLVYLDYILAMIAENIY